jgi:outer membrane protein assembly factor BamA
MKFLVKIIAFLSLPIFALSVAIADEDKSDNRPGIAPDIREDETRLKIQRGNFVVVPVPISNPTLDTGLVLGAAYFYSQTEEQQKAQPASVTAAGAVYTSNDSRAFALVQQNYWKNNKWRFTGAVGAADLRLSLLAPDESSTGQQVDWRINGEFLFAKLSRKLTGNWYGGLNMRVINADQSIEFSTPEPPAPVPPEPTTDFDSTTGTRSSGLGVSVEYDTRDMPLNAYSGKHFTLGALFNDEALGSDETYQTYTLAYRSYHSVSESLVLAWEIQGCQKASKPPLWDACTVGLRGFAATDYLGLISASGQVEARWKMSKRWGLVGFAGSGYIGNSFSGVRENEPIPSYGAGIRFTVLAPKRINLRLDFARSDDSDAIHFSVGEAF